MPTPARTFDVHDRTARLTIVLALLLGCGGSHADPAAPAAAPPMPGSGPASGPAVDSPDDEGSSADESVVAPPAVPSYAVHEWGLVDIDPASGAFEVGAGPGEPIRVVPSRPIQLRKPVLYFHSNAAGSFDVNAAVRVTGGVVVEAWPFAGADRANAAPRRDQAEWRWGAVTVGTAACTGQRYPARTSAACQGVPDGYCELADLAAYETNDSRCVTAHGVQSNHLFYRSTHAVGAPAWVRAANAAPARRGRMMQQPELPAEITPSVQVSHVVLLVRNGYDALATLHPVQAGITSTAAAPTIEGVGAARAWLAAELRRTLTESEAAAFERAWFTELFGGDRRGSAVRRSVLYLVPRAEIDRLAPLQLQPAPDQLRRVLVVRQSL